MKKLIKRLFGGHRPPHPLAPTPPAPPPTDAVHDRERREYWNFLTYDGSRQEDIV